MQRIFPASEWDGATIGACAAALLVGGLVGASNPTGLGLVGGFALGALIAGILLAIFGVPPAGLLLVGGSRRWLHVALICGSLGSVLMLGVLLNGTSGLVPGLFLTGPSLALMVTLGALLAANRLKSVIRWGGIGVVLLIASVGLVWLTEGPHVISHADRPSALEGEPVGQYEVRSFTYGSGRDLRPDYGDAVTIQSPEVDGRDWVDGWNGRRTRYWGFGPDRLPLNATVWAPDSPGPFPLVLIVHGNHAMEESSERGYGYLGEALASQGYIAASIDQNFLNGSWRGDLQGDVEARAWLLLEHLRLWHEWNADSHHPVFGLVDADRIALVGHSRGGEAVVGAAYLNGLSHRPNDATHSLDYGYSIQALVAISPSEGFYWPTGRPLTLRDISYLQLWGSHDADMVAFQGSRAYERVSYSGEVPGFKASAYIAGANHGQFNTDRGPKMAWFRSDGCWIRAH